jgi:L-rhamnose-H+ transport protein
LSFGILLVVVGGVMEGVYAVATRYTSRWNWEHIWGAGSLMALLLIAWPVAWLTVPDLSAVFAEASLSSLIPPILFGLGWGAGSIFFGLGVNAVGIAVGVSLIMGLIAVVGSLLPLVIYQPHLLTTSGGLLVLAALGVMIVGIIFCGFAGSLREKARAGHSAGAVDDGKGARPSFKIGLIFCVLSGVLSPMVNFALIKGDSLRALAMQHGASSLWAINAVWLLVFNVAYGLFVLYCLYLMWRNTSFAHLRQAEAGKYWLLAAVMGILWAGGIVAYGVGVAYMGSFGAYAGWPILLIAAIGASNISGFIVGEWKGTGTKPAVMMGVALAILFVAAIILGYANRVLAG